MRQKTKKKKNIVSKTRSNVNSALVSWAIGSKTVNLLRIVIEKQRCTFLKWRKKAFFTLSLVPVYISQYSFCLPIALDSVLQDKMDFTKLLFYSKVFFFFYFNFDTVKCNKSTWCWTILGKIKFLLHPQSQWSAMVFVHVNCFVHYFHASFTAKNNKCSNFMQSFTL